MEAGDFPVPPKPATRESPLVACCHLGTRTIVALGKPGGAILAPLTGRKGRSAASLVRGYRRIAEWTTRTGA